MCEPITMMAVMAICKASEISATNQAMEAQQNAAVAQQTVMNMQRMQEQEEVNRKSGLEQTQLAREGLRKRGEAKVASAESGSMGGAALRNLANVYMQESINAGSIVSLAESDVVRIGTQSQADYLKTVSAINIAESKKSTGLNAALQIGVAGAQGYASAGGFSSGTAALGKVGSVGYQPAVSSWSNNVTSFKNTWSW